MTTERRPLGDILRDSGRITDEDVARVLDYQRTHGGYFGQALVALGLARSEEIDWALASQLDLPFIFPHAEEVDRDATVLVPAEWALAHLAVPIVRAGRVLRVVVADPPEPELVRELQQRTGHEVEFALASAPRIRELIHALYDAPEARPLQEQGSRTVDELLSAAIANGATRFGVSVRGSSATGWWRSRLNSFRAPLAPGWGAALDALISPAPTASIGELPGGRRVWQARLSGDAGGMLLHAQAVVGSGGAELLFVPSEELAAAGGAETVMPPAIAAELRLLWRGGEARVAVHADVASAPELLPRLPSLALGDHCRAVHINESGGGPAFTVRAEPDEGFAGSMAAFDYDAVTIDLPFDAFPVAALLRAAPLTFVLLRGAGDRAAAEACGANWLLAITAAGWDLRPLHR